MGENIRLSLKGIWSHKMRSFLTMLGIIIGIAAIIAIVSTIQGTNEQIKQNLIGSGTNTVTLSLMKNKSEMDFGYESVPSGVSALSEDLKEQLLEIEGAEAVSYFHKRTYTDNIFYLNTSIDSATVYGINDGYLDTAGLSIKTGRGFNEADYTQFHKVALIDETIVKNTFRGENPVGKTVDIHGEAYKVIGVVTTTSSFTPVINSITDYELYVGASTGSIYIPDQTWPIAFQFDEPQSVLIQAASTDEMASVGTRASTVLDQTLVNQEDGLSYGSNSLAESAAQLQQLTGSGNMMMIGIASISLLVGGIGVMNIMLVSVTERTREIGLKKALGAKKRTILMQFLTEAAVLSLIGGIIGVLCGIILARIMAFVAQIPVAISIPSIVVAVLFSMAVGMIFGLAPSMKASKLNPIDALRYE